MRSSHQPYRTYDRLEGGDRASPPHDRGASSRATWSKEHHARQVEMVLASLWRRAEAVPRSERGG
jgi:hypothetical protein